MQTQQPQQKNARTLALEIIEKGIRKAQSLGVFSLEESVELYYALTAISTPAAPAEPVMRAEPGGKQAELTPEENV